MIERLFSILEVLADDQANALPLREIARQAELAPSTAHRILSQCQQWGAIERTASGEYQLGLKLWKLGLRYPEAWRIRDVAVPVLQDLYELTHQSVQLAVRDGIAALYVQRYAGRMAPPEQPTLGRRVPLHCTAVGQVLLAYADEEFFDRMVAAPLRRYTPSTLVDRGALVERCAEVRRAGFARVESEYVDGSMRLAAPVWNEQDRVVAAVSIILHSGTSIDSSHELGLRLASHSISRGLGWKHA